MSLITSWAVTVSGCGLWGLVRGVGMDRVTHGDFVGDPWLGDGGEFDSATVGMLRARDMGADLSRCRSQPPAREVHPDLGAESIAS